MSSLNLKTIELRGGRFFGEIVVLENPANFIQIPFFDSRILEFVAIKYEFNGDYNDLGNEIWGLQ